MPKIFSEEDRENIRNNLISKGLEFLEIKNYSSSSIAEIANAVGIAKGTFYNFFPSKEHFFYEVMLSIRDKNREELYELFSSKLVIDRDSIAEYLYMRYTNIKTVYDYFTIDEINIIFRKIPDKFEESNINSESLATELFSKIPHINPLLDEGVVINMLNLLGNFSANHKRLGCNSYNETIRLMADALADYIFDVTDHK